MQSVSSPQAPWSAYSSAPSKVAANAPQSFSTPQQDSFSASNIRFGISVPGGRKTFIAALALVGGATLYYGTNGSDAPASAAICHTLSTVGKDGYSIDFYGDGKEIKIPVVYSYAFNPKDGGTSLDDAQKVVQDLLSKREKYIDESNKAELQKAKDQKGYKAKNFSGYSILNLPKDHVLLVTMTPVGRGTFEQDSEPQFDLKHHRFTQGNKSVGAFSSNTAYSFTVEIVPKSKAIVAPDDQCKGNTPPPRPGQPTAMRLKDGTPVTVTWVA